LSIQHPFPIALRPGAARCSRSRGPPVLPPCKTAAREAELFTIEGDAMVSLGFAREGQPLMVEGYEVSLGPVKRYTAMQVYNRPQEPVLVLGSVLMFAGLVWHFYFRHRDRKRAAGVETADA
jgi:hypothetical protein